MHAPTASAAPSTEQPFTSADDLGERHRVTPLRAVLPEPSRTLLVASTGGHLKQLHRLRDRLTQPGDEITWLTFDTPQSRSLLVGEDVAFIPFTGPRDYRGVLGNLAPVLRLLRLASFDNVVSTGSAIALDCLPAAGALGLDVHYIESAARSLGPSATGRLLACTPGVRTYTQYPGWAGDRWRFAGSVFDAFTSVPVTRVPSLEGARVVVTLGTLGFPFPRLVSRLRQLLPPSAEVLWQTGATDPAPFAVDGHRALPNSVLRGAIQDADLVIAHAGCGAALEALESGQCPLLIPRRLVHREHVDDHQIQVAHELGARGLAVSREVDDLDERALLLAMSTKVVEASTSAIDLSAPGIRGAMMRRRIRRMRQRAPRIQRLAVE